ncbi:HU family DNA-binding protein [Devosia sp. A369]
MTTTVTRAMLSDAAARRTGLSKADTAAVGEAMFALIAEALMAGENVKLTAFGTLQLRDRAERIGRNPRTGTEHRIAPRQTVVFTPVLNCVRRWASWPMNQPARSARVREKKRR